MSSSSEQLMVHLREIEEAAEEVLSDKQEIVDLDRKRCQNREAIRAMSHLNHAGATTSSSSSSQWLAMGNCFFKSCLKTKPKLYYYRKVKYIKKWPFSPPKKQMFLKIIMFYIWFIEINWKSWFWQVPIFFHEIFWYAFSYFLIM